MKKALAIGVALYVGIAVYSLFAMKKSVPEMARQADHAVVGTVAAVDMVDRRGRSIESGETSLTGDRVIQLHVELQPESALKGGNPMPDTVVLPLWRGWKNSLAGIKRDMEGKEFIFFLKGHGFEPLFLGEFYAPLDQLDIVKQQVGS